ncbi:MAG: putative signal transduction histidine kinase [Polaromonas sp.]|nr:putative signal transduction histidine kinase [Polaromonas sp.]
MPTLKNYGTPEELVGKLREANQNLVIASLRAQDLQDQAEAAVARQNEFLSMLAHELRNPLAPIAMAAEMLEGIAEAHPKLSHIQHIIARQVSHMKRLLDDLLDASRVKTGKISLVKRLLLLTDIVQSAVEISQPFLNKHHQELIIDLPQHPVVIDGDAVRLAQVFSNLLINASKYASQHEPITLSARQGVAGTVAISVKDQGIGIEPEIQPFIFDLFIQATRTLDRSEGGLGVGLLMVRALVEMHGGRVEVRSEGLGCGSEFIVVLPVSGEPAPREADLPLHAPPLRPCRILVIEDNADANETLSFCLADEGHTVASALDGPTGLAMAKEGGYDIIVCDIGLPGMNGYEVLRQLRLLELAPVPGCIAMTGYDQQDFRAQAQEVGFDQYLVKPVSIDSLLNVIRKLLPQHP